MKVFYTVPPINTDKGFPTVGQNRQFQYLRNLSPAYPIIPALCMTMLFDNKHDVMWVDSIADQLNDVEFGNIIVSMKPDYIVMEAQTPTIKRYWEIINGIKQYCPQIKIILTGEHVTALPAESMKESKVDFIVKGGDWPMKVFELINKQPWPEDKPLPHINRNLTRWWLYAYRNGNFKYLPGTYIMSGYDCWHRPGCSFCGWANYHKSYQVRPVDDVLKEIEELICMGFKEIFDDSGTFPVGPWFKEFCQQMHDRKYYKHISFGCNMRFGALDDDDFRLMNEAGFRMVLWGMESVNQHTLDMLNKGYDIKSVSKDLIRSRAAKLQSHITVMFGYPWETYQEELRTYNMVKYFLKHGWAESAQASICTPYPGTDLFDYALKHDLITTFDWDEYDMRMPILKLKYKPEYVKKLQAGIYNTAFHPLFIFNKMKQIRSMNDFRYMFRIGRKIYDRFGNMVSTQKQ